MPAPDAPTYQRNATLVPATALVDALATVLPFRMKPINNVAPSPLEGILIGFAPTTTQPLIMGATNRYAAVMTTTDATAPGTNWTALGIPDDWRYDTDAPVRFYTFPTNAARVLGDLRVASGGTRRRAHPTYLFKVYTDETTGALHVEGDAATMTFPLIDAPHGVRSLVTIMSTHLTAEPMTPRVDGLAFNPEFLSLFKAFPAESPENHRTAIDIDYVPCNAGRDGLSVMRIHSHPHRYGILMPYNA